MAVAKPFQPRGDKPEWRKIYDDLLAEADYGRVVTYAELSTVLGLQFERHRSPIYRARRELGNLHLRWLVAVPKVGYRVIAANEHIHVADDHKHRARRQMTRMLEVARATDLAKLKPDELDCFDRQNRINMALASITMAHEQRIQRIESVLRADGKL
jgi:hypothetical protein